MQEFQHILKIDQADPIFDATPYPNDSGTGVAQTRQIETASFTTFFTWRGQGLVKINCGDSRIGSNSRIFASICEYNTEPRLNRFIGAALLLIYNISPYNGGVVIVINVPWDSPLNIRIDILVDP